LSLSRQQQVFAKHIALLILFADSRGYSVTFGDAYRDPRVHGEYGEQLSLQGWRVLG
jgi:hypothetical protein